jgi:hypothetical protein
VTGKYVRLSWWSRSDNANLHWASGCRGCYVVAHNGDNWSVDHRRGLHGTKQRHLGTAATVMEARAIAQADFDLVRSVEPRR